MENLGKPRLGFLGVGWIGRDRLKAVVQSGAAHVVGIADSSRESLNTAGSLASDAAQVGSLDELLSLGVDGVVIATPSGQHLEQCLHALSRGAAVFCQKPLARSAEETARVVEAARRANRLLAVDFSYRHTRACKALKGLIESGELGRVYAARFVFHNAYGPDKAWYLDRTLSGGGCLVDLGIHLVDLARWFLPEPIKRVRGLRYAKGKLLKPEAREVEDYASLVIELESGANVEVACSWHLHAGRDAVIEGQVFGGAGGARFQNLNGSFYDFAAFRLRGTSEEALVRPPDEWGGRAVLQWARRLAESRAFDPNVESVVEVARILDDVARQAS